MITFARLGLLAIVVATLAPVAAYAAAAKDPDWDTALAVVTRLKGQPQSIKDQRATLDSLEAAILDKAATGSLSAVIVDTALSLAELRQTTQTGDPYALLSAVDGVKNQSVLDDRRRERLATAFLAADLPWSAISLLDPIKARLDGTGRKTLTAAALALRVIRDDAASAAPNSVRYDGLSLLGARLLDLLGIPPMDRAGPCSDFTSVIAQRTNQGDMAEDPGLVTERTGLTRGPPLLDTLFSASASQPVEGQFKVTAEALTPRHAAPNSPPATLVSQVARLPQGSASPLIAREAGLLARLFGDGSAAPLVFTGSLAFKDGVILQFNVGTDTYPETNYFLIAVERGQAGTDFYNLQLPFQTVARPIEHGDSGQQIVLSAFVGSGGAMTLRIFDPANGRLWHLSDELYHGEYNVLQFGERLPFVIAVSPATYERRFEVCNQCPARRVTTLVRYDSSTRSYRAVAERRTGTDLFARTNSNIVGLSPEMFYDRKQEEQLLGKLRNRSPAYIAGNLIKDVSRAVGFVEARYSDEHQFFQAEEKLNLIIGLLDADGNSAVVRQARALVQIELLGTFIYNGEYKLATALADNQKLIQATKESKNMRLDYVSAAANLALMTGNYSRCYRFLKEWRNTGDAGSEGTFTWFLTLVGDYGSARAAGMRALNRATAEKDAFRYVAIDMLHLANAAQHLGRTEEAMDWLSRVLRMTRSMRGSDLDAFAMQIAADIALQNRLPGIATLLLDQAVASVEESVWDTNGPTILLLYGKAIEEAGNSAAADRLYAIAAERGSRERGAAMITANSARSDLADRRGDAALALKLSEEAFRAVLEGRSRVGQENYKLSFITNSASVGEQYLRLHAAAGTSPSALLDAVEAWRLQVFKDMYLGGLAGEARPQGIATTLQAALQPGEAYVSYAVGERWSAAILVTPSAVSVIGLGIDRESLSRDLSPLHHWLDPSRHDALAFIKGDRVPTELEATLRRLYDELIAPLKLKGQIRTLAISSDEPLAGVPWGALLQPGTLIDLGEETLGFQALHYLYQQLAIAVVPSAQILLGSSPIGLAADVRNWRVGLVGAFEGIPGPQLQIVMPQLDPSSVNQGLPELSNGSDELSQVAKAFRGQVPIVLLNSTTLGKHNGLPAPQLASRSAVLDLLPKVAVAHIIGHAVFNAAAPMESEILLDKKSHSVVTAEDLLGLDLSNIRLVVLSACETGQGRMAVGGESFGFLRGLMGAKARGAILSLWPVDDAATAEFFGRFYKEWANHSAGEALRLAAMHEFDLHHHPFFWAAPTLYGWWR